MVIYYFLRETARERRFASLLPLVRLLLLEEFERFAARTGDNTKGLLLWRVRFVCRMFCKDTGVAEENCSTRLIEFASDISTRHRGSL